MVDDEIKNEYSPEKSAVKEPQYSPLRLIGILSLIFFCTVLLVVATFTRIKLLNILQPLVAMNHTEVFPTLQAAFAFKPYYYIPQIPIILFTSTLLGGACSLVSVFIYIVVGLTFLPVFGLGGGFDYILSLTFGYILAFLPAALLAGKLSDKNVSLKNIFKIIFLSVLLIHMLGFLYMILISVLQHQSFAHIFDWIIFESLVRFIYDILFCFIFVIIAKQCRKIIWILTSV